jgi:hypothetical protein
MRYAKHWQSKVNGVLGAWVALMPAVIHFTGIRVAAANAVVVGLALVLAAVGPLPIPRAWEELAETALGLWLMVSPWVLEFSAFAGARSTTVATGALILTLGLWTLATDKTFGAWIHQRNVP